MGWRSGKSKLLQLLSVILCFSYSQGMNILFIGDNFTKNNDLPYMFKDIAESLAQSVNLKVFAEEGKNLEYHWKSDEVLNSIQTGEWDYVILQEQSNLPYTHKEAYMNILGLFSAYIRKASPHATISLFLPWANENSTAIQDKLTSVVAEAASIYDGLVAPCGPSFFALDTRTTTGYSLWEADGHNPSIFGSYLCAAVFFTEIFQKSPMDASPSSLEPSVATFLQKVAFSAVMSFIPFAPASLSGYYDTATSSVVLKWVDSSIASDSHKFLVERAYGSADFSFVGSAEDVQYYDNVLSGIYKYRVRAENKIGDSLYSNIFEIEVDSNATVTTTGVSTTGGPPTSAPVVVTTTTTSHSHYIDVLPGFHTFEEKLLMGGLGSLIIIAVGLFIWRTLYMRRKIKRSKVRFDFVEEEAPEY